MKDGKGVCLGIEHPLVQWEFILVCEQQVEVFQPVSRLSVTNEKSSLGQDRLTSLPRNN
jgi:hypothetical protein